MSQTNAKLQKRVPIRRRVMNIVLLTTLIALFAASITGIICIRWIKNSSENALTSQLENNLKSIVQQKAVSTDAKLEHYEKYIEFVSDYIERMYDKKDRMIELGRIFYAPENTKEYAMTRGFASKGITADDLKNEILFFSNLEQIWEPIAKENEGLITTVYIGTKNGLLASYDKWSYLSAVPKGKEMIYDYYKSDWYRQGMKEKDVFYTGLYVDSQGRGLTITVAAPFRDTNGRVMGVECADFDITGLYKELLSFDIGKGTISFALDKDGKIISPAAENKSVKEYTGLSAKELEELKNDSDGILEKKNAIYVCSPIERVGWTLCASIPREYIQNSIKDEDESIRYALLAFVLLAAIIIILAIVAVNKAAAAITHPMELLGRDMKRISDGDLSYRASVYRNDEIGDITSSMNEMVDQLNFTMNELMSTQQRADAMRKLAREDSLTNLRNKTAYEQFADELDRQRAEGNHEFGLAMIDLNNLKVINDSYGHDKGDIAIKKIASIVCETFAHSPVFRIGGDEFVVILRNADYENVKDLIKQFNEKIEETSHDNSLAPWGRVSAAIGYAAFDETLDNGADDVLTRADKEMYKRKRQMKESF